MTDLGNAFIDNSMQCWSCPIFDRMFQVISQAAANAYPLFMEICVILFCTMFAFYIFGAIWKNMSEGFNDGWFNKSLRPMLINSLFAVVFMGMGPMLPRFITTITFEPVAYVTETYSAAMLNQTQEIIDEPITYDELEYDEEDAKKGIFRTQLRDSVINTAKITISMFQYFMKLGVAIMDAGLSWAMFLGVGAFVKHLILILVGLYLFKEFFKMFFKFLCYFADVIIAMAMFAFFFPLSLATAVFKDIDDKDMPSWMSWVKTLGKGVGVEQIKNLISAIVSLGAAVIVYTVILVIIANFFTDNADGDVNHFEELLASVINGDIFETDLNQSGLNDLSLASIIVLVYVLTYIYDNIPKITEMILGMFSITPDKNEVGNKLGQDIWDASKGFLNKGKAVTKVIWKKVRS